MLAESGCFQRESHLLHFPKETPTHHLSEPSVSGFWVTSRGCTCSSAQNITFSAPKQKKNPILRSSLNILKIDFSII